MIFGMDKHIDPMNFTTPACTLHLLFYLIKWQKLYLKNWLQFIFVAKTTTLKQQILKFYANSKYTQAVFYIYDSSD